MRLIFLCLISISFAGVGCNQGDERLAEKARIEGKELAQAELQAQIDNMGKKIEIAKAEGRAQAESEVVVGNDNLAVKAALMEADLTSRQLFYRAIKGTYQGKLVTDRGDYSIRITLVPSLPATVHSRVRQLEEIASDLNNLFFHVQVLQWNPENPLSSVGCRIENIRPDLATGEIAIASANCPNLYKLSVVDSSLSELNQRFNVSELSSATAQAIHDGKISKLNEIRGEVHPTTNASIYTLEVKRSLSR